MTFAAPFYEAPSLAISHDGGGYFQITSRTTTGFTVQFFDAVTHAPVSRVFDWLANGY